MRASGDVWVFMCGDDQSLDAQDNADKMNEFCNDIDLRSLIADDTKPEVPKAVAWLNEHSLHGENGETRLMGKPWTAYELYKGLTVPVSRLSFVTRVLLLIIYVLSAFPLAETRPIQIHPSILRARIDVHSVSRTHWNQVSTGLISMLMCDSCEYENGGIRLSLRGRLTESQVYREPRWSLHICFGFNRICISNSCSS